MPPCKPSSQSKKVETLKHEEAKRKNIPTAEYQSVMAEEEKSPVRVAYERRNRDLDPQLVWRGKDEQDWSDLVVSAPPLYIQEKVYPKVIIDDLLKQTAIHQSQTTDHQLDLFADFNGLPKDVTGTGFYQHDANWTNRMILGDSLQVMASLAEREGLRGKVQCIYIDPPYGIKFNSNFQWSTTSNKVTDGKFDHITREPEQVKAFRDTWRDGIHSYLTYLRDRLTVARDLLTDSGSIFVQIGDENVHRVRAVMDEVFGDENFVSQITFTKTEGLSDKSFSNVADHILWFAKVKKINSQLTFKYRDLKRPKEPGSEGATGYVLLENIEKSSWRSATNKEIEQGLVDGYRFFDDQPLISQDDATGDIPFSFEGNEYRPPKGRHWSTGSDKSKLERLAQANRIIQRGNRIEWKRYIDEVAGTPLNNVWLGMGERGFAGGKKTYVVETASEVVKRCILMTTDPGDLVLDPTCGSGTTAYVAEQWGRRWITIDTSRVALALARARIMGARYPYYLLADSRAGQQKEAELRGGQWSVASGSSSHPSPATSHPSPTTNHFPPTYGNIRQGFVYERVPHITLKSIANNAEIDTIWENYQTKLEPLRMALNQVLSDQWLVASKSSKLPTPNPQPPFTPLEEWEIPREIPSHWTQATYHLHENWWKQRIDRQREIDASIQAKADQEYLYDKPYEDKSTVRVAGPFTVESLSPHRVLVVNEQDELVDPSQPTTPEHTTDAADFANVILENLKTAGVQQAHKEGKLNFTTIVGWPGAYICAEGRYVEGESEKEKRAGIFIGPEFGTVTRPDLVAAAREAGDAGFDVLIACAFNYDAHSAEFSKLGRIPVLKARMNADLHMADALKNTGAGNLFVIFGEPDIDVVSGLWLVTSDGQRVVNYDIVAELSGLGSLAEINRVGREDLPSLKKLSPRGEVRANEPTPQGSGVSANQHSGGSSAERNRGVSSISEHRQRFPGGSRNVADSGTSSGVYGVTDPGNPNAGSRHHWTDAQRSKAIAALQTLQPKDFPLTLTTNHQTQVTIHGVDVFHPQSGDVRSSNADEIACWFIDTDYNEESFFVRHAYFLGASDPYKSLKTTLKAEIDEEAWESLYSDTSRPFDKPQSGRIAVKVINHLGDEVMKVFSVD